MAQKTGWWRRDPSGDVPTGPRARADLHAGAQQDGHRLDGRGTPGPQDLPCTALATAVDLVNQHHARRELRHPVDHQSARPDAHSKRNASGIRSRFSGVLPLLLERGQSHGRDDGGQNRWNGSSTPPGPARALGKTLFSAVNGSGGCVPAIGQMLQAIPIHDPEEAAPRWRSAPSAPQSPVGQLIRSFRLRQ